MTVLPNDGFDMCCGNRPKVTHDPAFKGKEFLVECGVCDDCRWGADTESLMIRWNTTQWNKAQREKARVGG